MTISARRVDTICNDNATTMKRGVEDSAHTKRPARGAANRATVPPAAPAAAAADADVVAAVIPHASAPPII
jgi:hypothetical protein